MMTMVVGSSGFQAQEYESRSKEWQRFCHHFVGNIWAQILYQALYIRNFFERAFQWCLEV